MAYNCLVYKTKSPMNKDLMRQIMADHKTMYLNRALVSRDFPLEINVNYCFVGIRRAGKSYLIYQQIQNLLENDVTLNQIVYINFEDERLLEISAQELNMILEIGLEYAGEGKLPYLFFDEIQNVPGWEKFARRVADMKYRVSITGSNSKMLSKEIASTLGGRFMIVQVFPYSFAEYLTASGKEDIAAAAGGVLSTPQTAELSGLYDQYVKFGAFPELVEIKNKRDYLNSVYQTIYLGDVIARNKITNEFAVRLILKKIAEAVMNPLSFSRLCNILKSAGAAIGKQTVINYVGHMIDSYMIFAVQNYAAKLVDKESSPKYYFMDTGLLGLALVNPDCAQLENLLAIELLRRYGKEEVFYFESNIEIDFYVPSKNLAIQASYSVLDNLDTLKRETAAFAKLRKFLPDARCLIVTNSEEATLAQDGYDIQVVPMRKFLLEK